MAQGLETTYENTEVVTPEDRELHYGQRDHVRYFGRDFPERIGGTGFSSKYQLTAEGEDAVRYGRSLGQKIFIFVK